MYYKADYEKYLRISELSSPEFKQDIRPLAKQIEELQSKLTAARGQLAYIEQNHASSNILEKTKLVKIANSYSRKLLQLQEAANQYYTEMPEDPGQNTEEYVTQEYLDRMIRFAIFKKRADKFNEELAKFEEYSTPISLEEYAAYIREAYLADELGPDFEEQLYGEEIANIEGEGSKNREAKPGTWKHKTEKKTGKRKK